MVYFRGWISRIRIGERIEVGLRGQGHGLLSRVDFEDTDRREKGGTTRAPDYRMRGECRMNSRLEDEMGLQAELRLRLVSYRAGTMGSIPGRQDFPLHRLQTIRVRFDAL